MLCFFYTVIGYRLIVIRARIGMQENNTEQRASVFLYRQMKIAEPSVSTIQWQDVPMV